MHIIRRVFSYRITNPTLSGLYYAFVWMLMGALLLSLILWMSGMREQSLSHYTYVVHALSAFAGGLVSGKRSGKRGWYHGGMTGLIYGFLVIMIGFLALDSSIHSGDLILTGLAFASGSLGGMIGVNSRNN